MKKIVITFGRMNPPTVGHQKLVDKVVAVGKAEKAEARVYLSHTQNKKKDPLDYATKIRYAQKAFGPIVTNSPHKTIFQILEDLNFNGGYTDVVVVVGSDRVNEFRQLLNKYNGKNYNYDSIKIVSAGERDPDADDVSGMSASKLRGLAVDGKFAEFKKGLPPKLQSIAKPIYDKLRSIMEEEQLDEYAVLNLQQRLKRGRMMKRIAKKVARKRAILAKRMADQARLTKRSRKKALQFIRKRVAGERGKNYKELSAAEKMTIDKLVAKKSAVIDKLAKRLMPKVRKAEVERLSRARSIKKEEFETQQNLTEEAMAKKTFRSLFEQPIKPEITEKAIVSLQRKSAETGIPLEMIKEQYYKGIAQYDRTKNGTPEQQAFQRVNHFVAEAVKEPTGDLKDACWKGYTAVGMKMKNGKKVPNCVPKNEEAELDEIGLGTVARYLGKRFRQANNVDGAKLPNKKSADTYIKNIDRASNRLMTDKPVAPVKEAALDELSNEKLAAYKKKAAADASAADKRGDFKRGNKRFSGIMKATKKQFDNDAKKEAVATEWSKSRINEDLEKFLEDADRTLDRLRWADVPQMEPLKRLSNNQLKGYVRDYVSKNKDQVSKFMGTADTGMFGRAIIQKMAPKYIPQTKSMTDKDWDNAWKAYDNIDPKIKSNLKKGDTSDFQTNQYVKEDGYKWADFSDAERATIKARQDAIGGSRVNKTPQAFDSASIENRKKLADILRAKPKPTTAADLEPQPRVTPAEIKDQPSTGAKVMKNGYVKEAKIAHALDPKKGLKHSMKDVGVDVDADGDVDSIDKILSAPPEVTGTEKNQKKVQMALQKHGELEKKHTRVGVAYEETDVQKKNLKSILSKKREAKSTAGAGEWGTNELTNRYKKDTPGQSVSEETQLDEIGPLVGLAARGAASLATKGLTKLGKSDWWNKGRNVRVPDENKASWKTLARDDLSQMTRSDTAFKSGDTSVSSLRPMKAFTPDMVKTGPTAAVRQAVERPLKSVSNLMNGYCPDTGELVESLIIEEAEHEGKKVKLNDPFRLPAGSKKKFGVYVKNDKGNVVKVTFGDPNMEIKRDDPKRRAAFRSRHSCDDDIGPKWKARYWSCYQWRAGKKVDN